MAVGFELFSREVFLARLWLDQFLTIRSVRVRIRMSFGVQKEIGTGRFGRRFQR